MARTIPVDEVIAEACTILKHVTEQEKVFMRQWAYTALREIGFTKLDIQVSDALYLDDWSVQKPDNLVKTNDIALFSSAGSEIVHSFKGYASGQTFLTPASDWETAVDYGLQDRVLENSITYRCKEAHTAGTFSTDLAAEKWFVAEALLGRVHQDIRSLGGNGRDFVNITESENYFNVEEFTDASPDSIYLIVSYYAIPKDENGLPRIPEHCTLALIMYIRAMWAMRDNTNQNYIELAWDMWKVQRAKAEGRGKTPDILEGTAIAKTINSMVQKVAVRNQQF